VFLLPPAMSTHEAMALTALAGILWTAIELVGVG
jgi:hypothetical protein